MLDMLKSGVSNTQIAKELNVHKSVVTRVKKRYSKYTPVEK